MAELPVTALDGTLFPARQQSGKARYPRGSTNQARSL
jgi:hypothetical protein